MRRVSVFIAAVAVAVSGLFATTATVKAPEAQAWAWKDTCTMFIFNKTGQQTNVRPIVYTPVIPAPVSMAQYAIFAATGVPTSGAAALVNTGFPVTWGCHTFINFANPGPTVSCTADAPTKGANSFSCDGNASVRIIDDSDDIAGNIFIPSGSGGPGDEQLKQRQPKTGPPSFRRTHLVGKGWNKPEDMSDMGFLGRLMHQSELGAECSAVGGSGPNARKVSTGVYSRNGGKQWVGAVSVKFARKAQAEATAQDAVSKASMKCLRGLLTYQPKGTTARSKAMTASLPGIDMTSHRVKVQREGVGGRSARTHFMDVVATTDGKKLAFFMLGRADQPPSAAQKEATVTAVLKRMNR